MAFTEEQLQKMGLVKGKDGNYTKPKATVPNFLPMTDCKVPTTKKNVPERIGVHFLNRDIQDVYAECEANGTIFIPGNVPSLKNSKQLFKNKKTGRTFITSSEYCKRYVKETEIHYKIFTSKFHELIKGKERPYRIQLFFVREDKAVFDYINISQMVFDLMQKYNWIEKDDNRNVIPNFDCGFGYDPKLPGVIIKVI